MLFTSQGNNNGSAFAGLSGNTPFYNLTGGMHDAGRASGWQFPRWLWLARWFAKRRSRLALARFPRILPCLLPG